MHPPQTMTDWESIRLIVSFGLNCAGLGGVIGFMAAYFIFRKRA